MVNLPSAIVRRGIVHSLRFELAFVLLFGVIAPVLALAFFEARKRLLESLVVSHKLNVLHLDADTVWFANPYPLFKTLYSDYSLIVQTDNPFVNAGILYVQNAVRREQPSPRAAALAARHQPQRRAHP